MGTEGGIGGWIASGLTSEQYLAELAAYNAELAKDDYVIGATVFTAGATNDWAAFNTDPCDTSRFWIGGIPTMASPSEQDQDAKIAQEAAQNTDLVEALRRIRQGKWTGADGVDGMIVALQGGKPLDFSPSFP